jgi:hypothetical protein
MQAVCKGYDEQHCTAAAGQRRLHISAACCLDGGHHIALRKHDQQLRLMTGQQPSCACLLLLWRWDMCMAAAGAAVTPCCSHPPVTVRR